MKYQYRVLTLSAAGAFFMHLAWERAHIGLYSGYHDLGGTLPLWVWAALGDVLYTLGAVLVLSACKRSLTWLGKPAGRDLALLAVLGFFIALYVEYKAFMFGTWSYAADMPVVPFLNVGLSPVLQMTVLLPLCVWAASAFSRIIWKGA